MAVIIVANATQLHYITLHAIMNYDTLCHVCSDTGYLNEYTYCSCPAGEWYETRDELNEQVLYGELDIGDDYRIIEYINNESSKTFCDDNMNALKDLPFYE